MRKIRCPYCGKNVTKGIKKWRRTVRAAARHHRELEDEIKKAIDSTERRPKTRGTTDEFDYAEVEGMWLALSLSRTVLNGAIGSHHSHIDFYIQQRDQGHLPRWLTI